MCLAGLWRGGVWLHGLVDQEEIAPSTGTAVCMIFSEMQDINCLSGRVIFEDGGCEVLDTESAGRR